MSVPVTTEEPNPEQLQKRRLRWRSRRGLLELDLMFEPFLEHCLDDLGAEDMETYRRLLEEYDPTLQAWFAGNEAPAPEFRAMVAWIQQVARGAR